MSKQRDRITGLEYDCSKTALLIVNQIDDLKFVHATQGSDGLDEVTAAEDQAAIVHSRTLSENDRQRIALSASPSDKLTNRRSSILGHQNPTGYAMNGPNAFKSVIFSAL